MSRSYTTSLSCTAFALITAFAHLSICAQQAQAAPEAFALTGQVGGTHDPSIAMDHGTYYVFATGAVRPSRAANAAPPPPGAAPQPRPPLSSLPQLAVRCSKDLHQWDRCGAVFPAIPAWIRELSPKTEELWAPDVSYFDGLFHLYYTFSLFGKNTSGIALATNETLDPASSKYKWVDRGLVLRSVAADDFNAIDPNLLIDAKGDAWLSFGSFWSGIKMRRIDRKTGLLSTNDSRLYSLAARKQSATTAPRPANLPPDSEAIEAPFIVRHGAYYYLFVSWDLCCRGLKSTYSTHVGRSKSPFGPYVDRTGLGMTDGGGSPFLVANGTWLGPGGESLLHLPKQDIVAFHAYSAVDGHPALQISTVVWNDGWPVAKVEGQDDPSSAAAEKVQPR